MTKYHYERADNNKKYPANMPCDNCHKYYPEKSLTHTKTGLSCNGCYNPQSSDE